ncbi:MAG: hypothetical protein ABSH50_04475 [Bryobacteraceae bacterium]|jgi:hypothetical protein
MPEPLLSVALASISNDTQAAIERFLQSARQPALLEPGEPLLPLKADNFTLQMRSSRLTFQAWDDTRNLVRRVTGVAREARGRLELVVERFARKEGRVFLIDLARPSSQDFERRSERLIFRERLRQFLTRQFADWTLAEISAEPNLEASLSPSYTRALLRRGQSGWAAIGAAPESEPSGLLAFGLIWLDYLRHREKRLTVEGLALYVPRGQERHTSLRLPWLNQEAARYELFAYDEHDFTAHIDPRDFGNVDTRVEICRNAAPLGEFERLLASGEVERVARHDGAVSLRVRGVEFAQISGDGVRFGLAQRSRAGLHHLPEIERLARDLAERRSPDSEDREHPLYRQSPEAWLESQVRAQIQCVYAPLEPAPVYDQVPAFVGGDRGVLDLLAVERSGRLAVLELKATADLQLPLQALDYWLRVKWHLDRGEFTPNGYFPGIALRPEPPRLFLVCPALEFHPVTETILSFFAPAIEVERVGVGVEWRKGLRVMFRLRGAERPCHPCSGT